MMTRRLLAAAFGAVLTVTSVAPAFADSSWRPDTPLWAHRDSRDREDKDRRDWDRRDWERDRDRNWDRRDRDRRGDNVYVNRDGRAIILDDLGRLDRPDRRDRPRAYNSVTRPDAFGVDRPNSYFSVTRPDFRPGFGTGYGVSPSRNNPVIVIPAR